MSVQTVQCVDNVFENMIATDGSKQFRHIPPGLLHNGDISKVIVCKDCGVIALHEDQAVKCWACGSHNHIKMKAQWKSSSRWFNPATWGCGSWKIIKDCR